MTQAIIIDFPPLYDEIAMAFSLRLDQDIIFSWGDRLYVPWRKATMSREDSIVAPELIAHEAVHGERQGSGQEILNWWRRYIEDREFRLQEEIPAHRAEYQYILEHGNRQQRRSALSHLHGVVRP